MNAHTHYGQHPNCFDCQTAICPDCRDGKHRACFGEPCCCGCDREEDE